MLSLEAKSEAGRYHRLAHRQLKLAILFKMIRLAMHL